MSVSQMAFNADGMNIGASGASDTGNHPLANYFGNVEEPYKKMLAEDKFAHETHNLPKAFEGRNKHLETVINYLVTNDNDWYTSEVLPWVETEDLSIKWNIFKFNKSIMELEPHQGVPRFVTAERESRSDRLVRRGLAFIIEHGFYTTSEGRQHYLMNLRQIVDSVNETAYHGVIHAILHADQHYVEWRRQHGSRVNRIADLQRQQKRLWGIVQKQERGLYLLDAELKDTMRFEGVVPDTWIVPSKMSIYCTMVPSTETEYSRGGPNTLDSMEKGPKKMLTFRGSKVFESRPFDIDFIGEPYDLLVRRRQIGEHFIVGAGDAAADGQRDTYIYSCDSDKFERISFDDAFVAGLAAWPEEGDGKKAVKFPGSDDDVTPSADNKALWSVLCFRPFETYDMASGVLMKRGLETGMTAHGHHNFMLSDNVIHKTHVGHYTFYHASVIKQPKNIAIAEDIFARNYVRGEGVRIYANAREFRDDMRNEYFSKDLICVLIPKAGKVSNPCDITGRFEGSILDAVPSDLRDEEIGDLYPFSTEHNSAWRFDDIKSYGDADREKFLNPLRHNNTVTWQGMQLDYDASSQRFTKITLGTGHWGPNVYQGCKSVRTGGMAFLKDMEYEKARLKAGQF